MADFLACNQDYTVTISKSYQDKNNVTYYTIHVRIQEIKWEVDRRYKDFVELHATLVSEHGIAKDLLPPKKIIGNRDPQFIEKRKITLEIYLKTIINFLEKAMPMPTTLLRFLDFNKYDIMSIIQDMALYCYSEGDNYLQKSKNYIFTPLQLHAISRRLSQVCPEIESYATTSNFSHILDFCSHLSSITIRGGFHNVGGKSNIIYNDLPFELSIFKNISNLDFFNVKLNNISNLGTLRQTVTSIVICNSRVKTIGDALLFDKVHKDLEIIDESILWNKLISLDLSWNEINKLDNVIKLVPNLQHLTVDGNQLESLDNIELLSNLTHLCVSANKIVINDDFNLEEKLRKVTCLNLSQNKITSLKPFSKLFELRKLDIGSNWILDDEEINYITNLPHLDYLILTGNPVSTIIDYRIKIFKLFGEKASLLCLDNERASQKELDTAAVLRALSVVRDGS